MKVDIYKSTDTAGRFFVVPSGSDVRDFPEQVKGMPETTIDVNSGGNRVGLSGMMQFRRYIRTDIMRLMWLSELRKTHYKGVQSEA